ncbi:MAG: hypothetical protein KF901_28445 [Myxococcales bacterium]|nr:hypothetical protein [Myxococcales bacterium]
MSPHEAIEVRPITETPPHVAVVCVTSGLVGAHVGIWYEDATGHRRALHQAWHCRLLDEACDEHSFDDGSWVLPSLDENEARDLGTAARKVARSRGDGRVPYGFARRHARFRDDGSLDLADSSGLNCSVLVMMVFELAAVPLLDEGTWSTERTADRESEDRAAQESLLNALPFDQQEKLQNELGAPRVRAEEVAAASGLSGRPVRFEGCAPAGAALLERLAG